MCTFGVDELASHEAAPPLYHLHLKRVQQNTLKTEHNITEHHKTAPTTLRSSL